MVKKKRPKGLAFSNKAYLYLIPAFGLMTVFILYPMVNTFVVSFKYNYRFLTGDYVRFSWMHYLEILRDPTFLRASMNTFFMVFVCVPASMLSAFLVALGLNSVKRFRGFLATLYYLPQVTNVIAAGFVFALIFNNDFGLLNRFLEWLGFDAVAWISGVGIAGSAKLFHQSYMRCLFVLFTYSVWQGLSLKVILFMGGLSSINPQYYQVSQIDGTSKWKVLTKITLPLLSPTVLYVYITSSITAFKTYSAVVALFGNRFGPVGDNKKMMITLVGYIMDKLGNYMEPGAVSMAGTAAVLLLLIIMVLTAIQLRMSRKGVHYR